MVTTESTLSEQDQDYFIEKNSHGCQNVIEQYNEVNRGDRVEGFCGPIWDGIMCWNTTRAGETPTQPCPLYIRGFLSHRNASKQCLNNGSWYVRDSRSDSWTNYTQCYRSDHSTVVINMNKSDKERFIEPYLPTLRTISEVGYSASLIFLLVAFTILISIKRLRCPRNVLHMHLFASFIMRAFMSLLKDSLFIDGLGLKADLLLIDDSLYFNSGVQTNWCKLIISLWQYFIMANYFLILMEGLYLHNLIFLALFTDSSSITLYIVMGWGLPLMLVLPWTICRAFLENKFCWTINENQIIFLLIRAPLTASTVVNFILFVNIAKVLLRKLQSSICEETKTYRRWAKSTLVLLPLFGVHYMVFQVFQYTESGTMTIIWLFGDRIFTCFNGFFVALLYCFLNGEVRNELAKKWDHFSLQELLKRWHLTGHDSIFTSIRFLGNDRHHRPRGSCYSSASCTIETYVQSGTRDKKKSLATHITKVQRQQVIGDGQKVLNNVINGPDTGVDSSEIKNGLSRMGKDNRWSSSDTVKNAIELKRITSPDNIVNL